MERGARADQIGRQGRTLVPVPSSVGSSQGVPSQREPDQDFLISQLIEKIEALQSSEGPSAPKKASSARSSIVCSAHEPATCRSSPESAKVIRRHHDNQLRMLTHRWKALGLQPPVIGSKDDHTSKHLSQEDKTDCPLKVTALEPSYSRAPPERRQENSSSHCSHVGVPGEVKGNSMDVPMFSSTVTSEQSVSEDSDLSEQEKGRAQLLKWSGPLRLDLRPELYFNHLDSSYSTETVVEQVYAEVLPAPLRDLVFTHGVPTTDLTDLQLKLLTADPCLVPLAARLEGLEKLQDITVQRERTKPSARSRPNTASPQTKNGTRLRNSELPLSNSGSPEDAKNSSITCSFTKLSLCPSTSCSCRRDGCTLRKPRSGGRDGFLGKLNRPAVLDQDFSVSGKASPKPKTPNRTKRLRTAKKSSTKPKREDSDSASRKTTAASSRRT